MKNILIIGLGRFGKHLATKFTELGDEVMVIDRDEEAVQEIMNTVTYAQVGDCMKEEVLRSLGVNNFDICFVCMGEDFQSSLEITDLLKTLGAKYVVSKAGRDIHAKFLLKNGADEVIYPEKDMAVKTAVSVSFFPFSAVGAGRRSKMVPNSSKRPEVVCDTTSGRFGG